MEYIPTIITGLFLFFGGVFVGADFKPTVDKAIASLQAAEKSAAATLATITAHKAS